MNTDARGAVAELHVLGAGAAKGLVAALEAAHHAETGATLRGEFGAVGAIREKWLSGARCDVIILTAPMLEGMAREGRVDATTVASLGRVRTGVAVRQGDPLPAIADADALRRTLLAAAGIYFPDPQKATAGIHFARVLERLGISAELDARLRTFPNGATAMRAMAQAEGERLVGCTQVTEINNTPGVVLVGLLPVEFELATVYSAGVCAGGASPDAARRFVALLTGAASRALRVKAGFELGVT